MEAVLKLSAQALSGTCDDSALQLSGVMGRAELAECIGEAACRK